VILAGEKAKFWMVIECTWLPGPPDAGIDVVDDVASTLDEHAASNRAVVISAADITRLVRPIARLDRREFCSAVGSLIGTVFGSRDESDEDAIGSSNACFGFEYGIVDDLGQSSDASLVVGVGRWQEPALAEIYRRHGGAVHALARRLLRSDLPAEEITQDIFLDLWKQPEKFDAQRGTLRSYLLTRTHGKSVDHIRSEVARKRREERMARETATADYDMDLEVWDLAIADKVKDALQSLPEELRKPIQLAYFGGNTYQQVATLLDQPEGTVKSRIRSGLNRLRAILAELGVEPAGVER